MEQASMRQDYLFVMKLHFIEAASRIQVH